VFGNAGDEIVVEEFLDGEEASFFALCDGDTCVAVAGAQVCPHIIYIYIYIERERERERESESERRALLSQAPRCVSTLHTHTSTHI